MPIRKIFHYATKWECTPSQVPQIRAGFLPAIADYAGRNARAKYINRSNAPMELKQHNACENKPESTFDYFFKKAHRRQTNQKQNYLFRF